METPTHDVKVITVDFKAQVDENQQGSNSRIGPHGAGGTTQLIAGNTFFEDMGIHKNTWNVTDGHRPTRKIRINISIWATAHLTLP